MKQISTVTQMISGVDNVNLLSCTTYKHCAIYCGLKPWCIWLGFWLWFLPPKIKSSTKGSKVTCAFTQNQFSLQYKSKAPLPSAFTGFWVKKITHLSLVMSLLSHSISERNQMHLICAPGSSLHTYDRRHK